MIPVELSDGTVIWLPIVGLDEDDGNPEWYMVEGDIEG